MSKAHEKAKRAEAFRLLSYARELGLKREVVAFIHRLLEDPKRRVNVARMAVQRSSAWASKWGNDARAKKYMRAVEDAKEKLLRESERKAKLAAMEASGDIQSAALEVRNEFRREVAQTADALLALTEQMYGRVGDYIHDDGTVNVAAIKAAPPGLIKSVEINSNTRYDKDGNVQSVDTRHKVTLESSQAAADIMLNHYRAIDDGSQRDMRPMFVLPPGSRVAIAAPDIPALPATPASVVIPTAKRTLSLVTSSVDGEPAPPGGGTDHGGGG